MPCVSAYQQPDLDAWHDELAIVGGGCALGGPEMVDGLEFGMAKIQDGAEAMF